MNVLIISFVPIGQFRRAIPLNFQTGFKPTDCAARAVFFGRMECELPWKIFINRNKFLSAHTHSRENGTVQIRFLLGPAGSGKTFRCLSEIRAALKASPEGPPLSLL